MEAKNFLGLGIVAAAGYGLYKVLRPSLALAGLTEPDLKEGTDYEVVNGSGTTNTALKEIKAKEYQLRQMPDKVAEFMRRQQEYVTKNTQTTVPPQNQGHFYGNGLSDKQRAQIAQAGLRHAKEQTAQSGKVINNLGRPE